ncbi:hypothetical protein TCAL_03261 [Tigriopus californicus]|uniref:NOT2/NOT3/NOT5 C-terminal domain-containing protein n=1 Tax=Tigriopus californicus TaxID=6832 RepID=A0A553NTG1_TIGCA|nr:CCR4-NOT transcription complex subunit 2-like [Tigriopus californicus]TRY68713.1 hypothetical protein TCAL_03261 [Tigriopus californicus]
MFQLQSADSMPSAHSCLNPLSKPFAPRSSASSEPNSPPFTPRGSLSTPFFRNNHNNNNIIVSHNNINNNNNNIPHSSINNNLVTKFAPPPPFGVDVTTMPPPPASMYGAVGTTPPSHGTALRADEFGLRGLLQNIQATHYSRIRRKRPNDPYESTVVSREDLGFTDEAIRFHGPKLLPHFESPFNSKFNTLYLDHDVPEEYYTAWKLSGCLKGKWSHYLPTDLLFFLFYTAVGDILQLEAAAKLFDRGWRFLREKGVWISRKPNCPPEYASTTEQFGEYQYFDAQSWERKSGNFKFKLEDLATKVQLPRGPFPMANGYNVCPTPPVPLNYRRRELPRHPGMIPPFNAHSQSYPYYSATD